MAEVVINNIQGVNSAPNPLSGRPGSVLMMQNMVSDIHGWAVKRRGIKQLSPTANYTSVFSGLTADTTLPVCGWYFDDHIFLYVEDSTSGGSGICAYSMVTNAGWHKVVESTSTIRLDSTQFKPKPCIADRRLLLNTAAGVKRIAAIYDDYFPKGSTTNVNYSSMYRDAGIPRALDPRVPNAVAGGGTSPGLFAVTGYEWLTPSSSVAYQVNWFKRDENAIPGVGAPSGRVVVRNTNTTTSYAVRLKIPIPAGVSDTSYVLQINRTTVVTADATGDIPDPGSECFLAGEYRLTSTDLSNKYVLYDDVSVDQLMGDDLYTNETQDGAGQARFQPPICRDIATFGGCAFYANTTEKQRLTIKLLAVDQLGTGKGTRVGDMIVVGDLVMEAVAKASEETQTWYFAVDDTTGAGSEVIRALKTAESLVYKYNLWSNATNGRYYAYNITNNNDVVGVIQLEEKSIGGSTGAFLGVNRIDSPVQILPVPVFTSTPSNTVALACDVATNAGPTTVTVTTASAHNLTTNDLVFLAPFANSTESGTSSPRLANTDVPAGVYKVTVTGGSTFTFPSPAGSAASQTDARTATTGGYVHKIFDTTTSVWTEARSDNNRRVNRLMWSAFEEPECAPVENVVDIGAADRAILRTVPTQDSLFILKEDGVWRLKGEAGDWEIIVLDKSCILAAYETPGVVDGRVFCYSTNGVVSIDDGGVAKVSGAVGGLVDNYYRALATNPANAMGYAGTGHGEDKAYILSFLGNTWRYHCPTRTWSGQYWGDKTTPLGTSGISASGGVSFIFTAKASRYTTFDAQAYAERLVVCFGDTANCIGIERKTGRLSEICDLDIPVTVSSFNASASTVTLASMPTCAEIGDVFLWYANANYIPGNYGSQAMGDRGVISAINGNVLTLENTNSMSGWPAVGGGQSGAILKQIQSRVIFNPIPAGDGMTLGHFAEVDMTVGGRGRFSKVIAGFNSEPTYDGDVSVAATNTSTISGYATTPVSAVTANRNPGVMDAMRTHRTGIPRTNAAAASIIVSFANSRALEFFDLAGVKLIYHEGDNRTKRTNA